MGDYTRQRATALRLIEKSGKPVTMQRTAQGEYDPSTGGSVDTVTSINGYGVMLNFKNTEIDGSNILSGDRKMLYVGDEPKVNDVYINKRVVEANPLDPDESGAIMYTCQMRGV